MEAAMWNAVVVIGKVVTVWVGLAFGLAGLWCVAVLVGRRAGGKP